MQRPILCKKGLFADDWKRYSMDLEDYATSLEDRVRYLAKKISLYGNTRYLSDAQHRMRDYDRKCAEIGELRAQITRLTRENEYLNARLDIYENTKKPRPKDRDPETGKYIGDKEHQKEMAFAIAALQGGIEEADFTDIAMRINVKPETARRYASSYRSSRMKRMTESGWKQHVEMLKEEYSYLDIHSPNQYGTGEEDYETLD